MKKILQWIANLFTPKITRQTRYMIDGKEVSEAEWYANGGLELEERIERLDREIGKWDEY
jgi:hypothetical protein